MQPEWLWDMARQVISFVFFNSSGESSCHEVCQLAVGISRHATSVHGWEGSICAGKLCRHCATAPVLSFHKNGDSKKYGQVWNGMDSGCPELTHPLSHTTATHAACLGCPWKTTSEFLEGTPFFCFFLGMTSGISVEIKMPGVSWVFCFPFLVSTCWNNPFRPKKNDGSLGDHDESTMVSAGCG